MNDLPGLLKALIERSSTAQQTLAIEWITRWNRASGKELKVTTAESRLSEMLKGKPEGVRFFFGDPARGRTLLEVLGATEAEAELAMSLAGQHLGDGLPPRLLLPLADQLLEDGFWDAFKDWLGRSGMPKPVVALVSEAQHDKVPRSLDKLDGLSIREVEPEKLIPMIRQTVEAGGLVAEPNWRRPEVPFDQWLALRWRKGAWEESPAEWGLSWQATGRMPGLTSPNHPLVALDFVPAEKAPPLPEGPALRDYVMQLVAGHPNVSPSVRLRHAEALGLEAGATDEEVVACQQRREDAAVKQAAAQAGIEVQRLGPAELPDLLRRARYQATQLVVGVEDRWHWINASPADDLAPGRIEVHAIEVQPTAVDRLWAEVKGWTAADLEEDPLLAAAAARLDPNGADALAFQLARAWLLLDGLPTGWPARDPAPELITDPVPALRALLNQPSPPAELCLAPTDDSAWTNRPAGEWEDKALGVQRLPTPGAPVWLGRGQALLRLPGSRQEERTAEPWGGWKMEERGLLRTFLQPLAEALRNGPTGHERVEQFSSFIPIKRVRIGAADAFAQVLDRALGGTQRLEADIHRWCERWSVGAWARQEVLAELGIGHAYDTSEVRRAALQKHTHWRPWAAAPFKSVTLPTEEVWLVADRSLAQIRRRLRILLEQGEVDVLHDGKALLPLAPGLDAQIVLHRARVGGPAAALRVPVSGTTPGFSVRPKGEAASLFGPAFARTWLRFGGQGPGPDTANIELELPHAIHLRDGQHEAVITFVPNPFSG
jgi:hypothetical protein